MAANSSWSMEFFDFTGTNDEEKAQAWDVIRGCHQSTGVEFFFEYNIGSNNNISNNNNNNNNHSHKSPIYINNVNGILSPPNVPSEGPPHPQQPTQLLPQPSQQRPAGTTADQSAAAFANQNLYSNQNHLTFQAQSNWNPSNHSGAGGNAASTLMPQQSNLAASPPMGFLVGPPQPPPPPTGAAMSSNGGAPGGAPGTQGPPPTHMAPNHYALYAPHPGPPPPPAFPHPHALFAHHGHPHPHHGPHPHPHPHAHPAAAYPPPPHQTHLYFINPHDGAYPYPYPQQLTYPKLNSMMELDVGPKPPQHYASTMQQQLGQPQQSVPHSQVIQTSTNTPPISINNSQQHQQQQQITQQMTQQQHPQNILPLESIPTNTNNNNDLKLQQEPSTAITSNASSILNPSPLPPSSSSPLTETVLSSKLPPPSTTSESPAAPVPLQTIESSSLPASKPPQPTLQSSPPPPKSITTITTTSTTEQQPSTTTVVEEQSINTSTTKSSEGGEANLSATALVAAAPVASVPAPKPSAPVATTWSARLFGSQSNSQSKAVTSASSQAPASSTTSSTTTAVATSAAQAKSVVVNGDIAGESGTHASAPASASRSTINGGDFPELSSGGPKVVHSHQQHPNTQHQLHQQNQHSQFHQQGSNQRTHKNRRGGVQHHNQQMLQQQHEELKLTIIPMSEDPVALKLAKKLHEPKLKHSLPIIMPCGLINRGNWCYVNATLQALLACPPFYNLMREISETPNVFREATSTPIIDNFARYFGRFQPADRRQIKSGAGAAGGTAQAYLEELLNNDPFEPACIYDTLKHIGMIKNDQERGHQEDAEEFLSSLLNGLHEEMIKLSELYSAKQGGGGVAVKTNGFASAAAAAAASGASDASALSDDDHHKASASADGGDASADDGDDNDDDVWHEVGTSKHKALPTRSATVVATAITQIFGGSALEVRTVNTGSGNKPSTGNRQPFFDLQLDIKPNGIATLEDALRWQTRREAIHGYVDPKTRKEVEASNQMFLETVPPILVLHLKLFDYDVESGANRKVLKRITYHENFEIPRDCFPNHGRGHRMENGGGGAGGRVGGQVAKKYKLLAVVYHSGAEAMKGHYITDVYHLGLNQWLRCDDASIKVISINQVLATNNHGSGGSMVPYLLFYRRQDGSGGVGHGPSASNANTSNSSSTNSNTSSSNNSSHQQSSSAAAARHLLSSDI